MDRRVYWLLPDAASARATMDDLLRAGLPLRRMHFVARDEADLAGLHAANVLQTSEVLRSAEAGLVVGAALGGLVGALAATLFPDGDGAPRWALVPLLVLLGALFDAWTASMIGISVPSRRLRRFEPDIAKGCILLIADVPPRRARELGSNVQALHPEARFEGAEADALVLP